MTASTTTQISAATISLLDCLSDACVIFYGDEARSNRAMNALLLEEPEAGALHQKVQELAMHISVAGRAMCLEYTTRCATYRLSGGPIESTVLVTVIRAVEFRKDTHLRTRYGLTDREAQIARLLAAGKSNSEIAETLRISPHTARHHTGNVIAKLGLPSRARVAAALART